MNTCDLFDVTDKPGYIAPKPNQLQKLFQNQSLESLYKVEEQPFARGKYAAVKICREKATGKQWAAKFLKKRRHGTEEALHEIAILNVTASCPHLVSLHQVFETNTEIILILELAAGGELQTILDRDEIPEERIVVKLMKQILDGLQVLHSLRIVHLDIKPQNLVLTGQFPNCDVKLCDFGISRFVGCGTEVREMLGTPDYVAPEVLNYEPISEATDMWSVGVLLYVLLTGCSPFGGDTKQETFCNISKCILEFPEELFEDISEEACDLMSKLIVKNPKNRLTVKECLQHAWFTMPMTTLPSSADESTPELPATKLLLPEIIVTSKENTSTGTTTTTQSTIGRSMRISSSSTTTTLRSTSSIKNINEVQQSFSPTDDALRYLKRSGFRRSSIRFNRLNLNSNKDKSHTDHVPSFSMSEERETPELKTQCPESHIDRLKKNMAVLAQKFSYPGMTDDQWYLSTLFPKKTTTVANTTTTITTTTTTTTATAINTNIKNPFRSAFSIIKSSSPVANFTKLKTNPVTNFASIKTNPVTNSSSIAPSINNKMISQQHRAVETRTMPANNNQTFTPMFILGEAKAEKQGDSGAASADSDMSVESASDRSSIYSDDSVDIIVDAQMKRQSPVAAVTSSRWERRNFLWRKQLSKQMCTDEFPRIDTVNRVISHFREDTTITRAVKLVKENLTKQSSATATATTTTTAATTMTTMQRANGTNHETHRDSSNVAVVRPPIHAGNYGRHSDFQFESVKARIRRFQTQEM